MRRSPSPPAIQPSATPDQAALARVGAAVRARLAADPGVYRVPHDGIELFAVGSFLAEAECARFIAMIEATACPSPRYDPENPLEYRTSYSGDVERSDPFVQMIERRIDDLVGLPAEFGETIQGQRYRPGEEFQGHHDFFYAETPYWPGEVKMGGQRSWTTMAYLNPVEAGGSTDFTRLGLSIAPQPGALLLWNNALPDGTPNQATLHAGMPVLGGVKYIFTKWYRTRKWGY